MIHYFSNLEFLVFNKLKLTLPLPSDILHIYQKGVVRLLISIDFNSNIPIYIQVYNQFLSFIINGILKDGEKLPSARSLAKQLELNVLTINKTYKKLRDEGLIDIYPKKGSFVNISKKQIYSQDYINQKLQYEINNLVLTSYEYKIDLQIVLNSLIYTYNNFIKGDNGNDE